VVRRRLGGLGPVQHGVRSGPVDRRDRGRARRLRRPPALHRRQGHVARAEGRRLGPVDPVRLVDCARLLGGRVLLRSGSPPCPRRDGRPGPLLLGRYPRRGVDEPRGARRGAVPAIHGGGLRRRPERPRGPEGLRGAARRLGGEELPPGRLQRRPGERLGEARGRRRGVAADGAAPAVGEGGPADRRRGVVPPRGRDPRPLGREGPPPLPGRDRRLRHHLLRRRGDRPHRQGNARLLFRAPPLPGARPPGEARARGDRGPSGPRRARGSPSPSPARGSTGSSASSRRRLRTSRRSPATRRPRIRTARPCSTGG
jgi:hypothetical protein